MNVRKTRRRVTTGLVLYPQEDYDERLYDGRWPFEGEDGFFEVGGRRWYWRNVAKEFIPYLEGCKTYALHAEGGHEQRGVKLRRFSAQVWYEQVQRWDFAQIRVVDGRFVFIGLDEEVGLPPTRTLEEAIADEGSKELEFAGEDYAERRRLDEIEDARERETKRTRMEKRRGRERARERGA